MQTAAEDHGVILLFHHVSDDTPPSTSVTPGQFAEQLAYIADNDYQVVPLKSLLKGIYSGVGVPAKSVSITFDDAYLSVYENAFPLLRARGWPFTVFVADTPVEKGFSHFMSWQQLAEMLEHGAEVGGHSADHSHLVRQLPGETLPAWRQRVESQIDDNLARLQTRLGTTVRSFAYPYGESNEHIAKMIHDRGLYGLVQYSGAVGPLTPTTSIPRFPLLRSMASIDRLALALDSRPLPVTRSEGGAPIRQVGDTNIQLSLTLGDGAYRSEAIACFSARGDRLTTELAQQQLRTTLPNLTPGRNKINCTAPAADGSGDFYWFSHQWLAVNEDGSWPEE